MAEIKVNRRFLVAVSESATRDTQITDEKDTCDGCSHEKECSQGECPVPLRKFYDFKGHVMVGIYISTDRAGALLDCSIEKGIHVNNLIAYELK